MNARTRLAREIVRRRRTWPHPWPPPLFTRITTPNGTPVRVTYFPGQCHGGWGTGHADYIVSRALVYGHWPPTPDLIRELGRWA